MTESKVADDVKIMICCMCQSYFSMDEHILRPF